MGTASFWALLLLTALPSWNVGQDQSSDATTTNAQTKTSAKTNTNTNNQAPAETQSRPGNAAPQRAPDGDVYKPPTSVQRTPKNHPPETNTGRPSAQARSGSEAGSAIGGAAAAGGTIVLGEWLHARNKPEARLSRDGPMIPDQFNMSGFSVGGFCQGNWPVVVDYVLNPGAVLLVTVETQGVPAMNYSIQITGSRRLATFRLPTYFPQKPTPGMYTIRALSTGAGLASPAYVRLFGLAAGERAVGSVAIDQVRFGPDAISPKQKQEANYAFHAHTDFDRVRAEFMKAVLAQGQLVSKLEDHDDINGVQRETTPARKWNGEKATPGDHLLQVRAWESALNMSNWVIAWSADQVLVQE
jgi:hypothetical protein